MTSSGFFVRNAIVAVVIVMVALLAIQVPYAHARTNWYSPSERSCFASRKPLQRRRRQVEQPIQRGIVLQQIAGIPSHKTKLGSLLDNQDGNPSNHHDTTPTTPPPPTLIIIGGAPGTGKSTFGMHLALQLGILKCISTDTVRAVMRTYVSPDISPALHRSSYLPPVSLDDHILMATSETMADGMNSRNSQGDSVSSTDDPVYSWKETCKVLENGLEGLVDDAIARRTSLVLEGVSIRPSIKWLRKWKSALGDQSQCCGILLTVTDGDVHKSLLNKRGFLTGNAKMEQPKLQCFDRIRSIQDEMVRLAEKSDWLLMEQEHFGTEKTRPDPVKLVREKLAEEMLAETDGPEIPLHRELQSLQTVSIGGVPSTSSHTSQLNGNDDCLMAPTTRGEPSNPIAR